jgi:hypothetical protein
MIGFVVIAMLVLYGAMSIFINAGVAFGAPNSAASAAAQNAPALQAGAPSGPGKTVPHYLNYQGVLRDPEGKPMSGLHKMTFRIYDRVSAPLNEAIYMEEHEDVTVRNGQFSVLLGNNTPLPSTLFFGPDTFIGVTVAPFDEMVPRQRFASVPYAVYADHASSLTRPDGAADLAVYVDPVGKVGIGTTSPTAQVHISNTTGATTTVQINAGGQQLALDADSIDTSAPFQVNAATNANVSLAAGGGLVGIGTTAPNAQLHLKSNNPHINLDINAAGGDDNSALDFSQDGVSQAALVYSKSTNNLYVNSKGATSMTFAGGAVGVNTTDPKTTLDVNGDLWVRGNLRLGGQQKHPLRIIRMGPLGADSNNLIDGVSPDEYDCVAASWSVRMDVDEDDAGNYTIWTYVEGSNWMLRSRFWTDKPETAYVDVLCFLRGAFSNFEGDRSFVDLN